MNKLEGHWKLSESENFEEYLKAVNVNIVLRKVAARITTYEDIQQLDNEEWELKTSSTFTNTTLHFKLGEVFDEVTPSGHHMKTTITFEDGKWHQVQKANDPTAVDSKVTRELIDDNNMLSTYEAAGVVSTRKLVRYKS